MLAPTVGTQVVGSLLVDDHPLIQLATIRGGPAGGLQGPVYALRVPSKDTRNGLRWVTIGHLSLEATALPAVLLAGLSVLAINHTHEAAVQIG